MENNSNAAEETDKIPEGNIPVLEVINQYIKDLSFENINPISRINMEGKQPKVMFDLKASSEQVNDNIYSVSLTSNVSIETDQPLCLLELTYTGDFIIGEMQQELIDFLLNVECPRLLFPFVRQIIANVMNDGGYPGVYLSHRHYADLLQNMHDSKQTMQ